MHNLHFIVTPAESGLEACHAADSYIESWGTENNWRTASGAVSEDNEVFDNSDNDGRFKPDDEGLTSMDKINELVKGWIKNENIFTQKGEELIRKHVGGEKLVPHEWWQVKEWAEKRGKVAELEKPADDFNVITDSYYEYEYDRNGVTHTGYKKEDGERTWVVFIDMHA